MLFYNLISIPVSEIKSPIPSNKNLTGVAKWHPEPYRCHKMTSWCLIGLFEHLIGVEYIFIKLYLQMISVDRLIDLACKICVVFYFIIYFSHF